MCNVVLRVVHRDIMCTASLLPKQHIPNWFFPHSLHLPGDSPVFLALYVDRLGIEQLYVQLYQM